MSAKIRKGASIWALAAATLTGAAFAQQGTDTTATQGAQAQPPVDRVETESRPQGGPQGGERIVVTGSNIVGAVESAALPVEVFTAEDAAKTGSPTGLEFLKSLSVVGSTVGETNQFQAGYGGIGSATLNLRGLGGGRSLTIFNGRRFSENVNMIPNIALARTEILKDGGAVIYGADATGGVVNFITRDNFDGLLVDGEYKFIDGSDGDYNLAALWGKNFDTGNLMFSLEYSHKGELDITERDWAVRSFAENNTPWAPYHNYGTWILRPTTAASGLAANVPGVGPTLGVVQDYTADQCRTSSGPVEGQPLTLSGLPVCWWNYAIHTYNLVDEVNQIRGYAQITNDLSDSLRFTGQVAYGKSDAPAIGTVASYQANVGASPLSGTAFQYRTPRTNPYFASFLQQNAVTVPAAAIDSADQFLSIFFGPSGNPAFGPGQGTTPTTQLENWNVVGALDGEFGDWSGGWLDTWKFSAAYNLSTSDNTLPDIVAYRVQEALNGFGGPNCQAADLVPDNWTAVRESNFDTNGNGRLGGTLAQDRIEQENWLKAFYATIGTQNPGAAGRNGCLYLNPFSSSYPTNGAFGTPNPRYITGNDIPPELAAWLYDERQEEDQNQNLTIDALVNGTVAAFELPGGPIGWAAGAQWRQSEGRETTNSRFLDPRQFPCQWPGQRPGDAGCPPTGESPYFFFGTDEQTKSDQQQYSYFAETSIPLLDRLSFQLAVRREEFPKAGLGATVYKIAGKWDPFDWLAVRGSFGTNYASVPSTFIPGEVTSGLSLIQNAGNRYLNVQTETLSGVKPETAEVGNFGVIFNFDNMPLDGTLRASFDYFNFKIQDEIKTVSHNQVLNTTFVGARGETQPINCSAPLIDRITFIGGQGAAGCTQGTTLGRDVTSIRSVRGNGPGAETSGIDVDISYAFTAGPGEATLGVNGTNVLTYEVAAFSLNGVELSPAVDALGFANYSRDGDLVSEWRANATANYELENHNLRYQLRYIQGVEDDRFATTSPFRQIDDFITHNLYYQYTLPFDEDFTLSLSIENLTDEDPPFTQQQYSYDPFIGNPLGRTYEIGLRKQF
jgi:iron complex outermembrane recepter protein